MAESVTVLQDEAGGWFVLQKVDEAGRHFQLVDTVDLVDLFEVSP